MLREFYRHHRTDRLDVCREILNGVLELTGSFPTACRHKLIRQKLYHSAFGVGRADKPDPRCHSAPLTCRAASRMRRGCDMREAQSARELGDCGAVRESLAGSLRSLPIICLALVIALCGGVVTACGSSDTSEMTTTTTTTTTSTTTSPTPTTSVTTRSTTKNGGSGQPSTSVVTCPDGSTVPAGQACPFPEPQPCPDGSTAPPGQTCPTPHRPTLPRRQHRARGPDLPRANTHGSTMPRRQDCARWPDLL